MAGLQGQQRCSTLAGSAAQRPRPALSRLPAAQAAFSPTESHVAQIRESSSSSTKHVFTGEYAPDAARKRIKNQTVRPRQMQGLRKEDGSWKSHAGSVSLHTSLTLQSLSRCRAFALFYSKVVAAVAACCRPPLRLLPQLQHRRLGSRRLPLALQPLPPHVDGHCGRGTEGRRVDVGPPPHVASSDHRLACAPLRLSCQPPRPMLRQHLTAGTIPIVPALVLKRARAVSLPAGTSEPLATC